MSETIAVVVVIAAFLALGALAFTPEERRRHRHRR